MLAQLSWPSNAADSPIMCACRPSALRSIHDEMPRIVEAPWMLIFRMWQQAWHLPFSLYSRQIHSRRKNVTLRPFDCWMCKTKNRWRSVDTHTNYIKTASVHSIKVCNESYKHYWHRILCLYVLSLHPLDLLPLNFWSTTIHTMWVRDRRALSHSCIFSLQFMACRSFH